MTLAGVAPMVRAPVGYQGAMRTAATGTILLGALAVGAAATGPVAHASAPPAGTVCSAVPDGLALVVADADGVAIGRSTGTERLTLPAFASAPTLAVRGPDGTVWAQAPTTPTETTPTGSASSDAGDERPAADVFRIGPGASEAVGVASGPVWLTSAGWLADRSAAAVLDFTAGEGEPEESSGAKLVDFADGEQRELGPAAGIEYGVNSLSIGAGRVVEGAYADLGETFSVYDASGTRLEDWPSPITPEDYAQPPLFVWPVAAVPPDAGEPVWSWVEAPDYDMEAGEIVGGWTLVVADAASGEEQVRLDLGDPGDWLAHADFDGRFWVGTFSDAASEEEATAPAGEPPARVLVVDTAAAEPAVADAGCAAGVTATIDRDGTPPPPATAPPPTTTATTAAPTTEARCTYVEADDAFPLRTCDKGPAVAAVQVQINKRGQDIDADGYFGPATEQAVRNFQEAAGLEVDGLVGPETWAALYTGEPGGTDADGNGTIEPWEVDADTPGGGDAASYVGLVFEEHLPDNTIHTPEGEVVPGLTSRGGSALADDPAVLPFFAGKHVLSDGGHMLWLTRADGRNPDGTLQPQTVVAAVDLPALAEGQSLDLAECWLDGAHDQTVAAVTQPGDTEGFRDAVAAWQFDVAAGTINEIDASRVQCAILGDG